MKQLLLALLVLTVAPLAHAQPESAYYGVSLGAFDYEEEDSLGGEVFADTASSYRLMVGYQFMEYDWDRVAVRLAYEKFDFDGDVDVAETSISFFYKL